MSDFMEEVTEASDDAVASEGECSPSSYVGELSTNIWTLWRRDMSIDFVGDWLKEMELLDVVETWSDFLKVMVNLTAPLAKSMKPLQYFYFKNSVMPTFEDSENFNGCRCTVFMRKKNGKAAQTLFINLCIMAMSSQNRPVMQDINGIVFGYSLKGFKVSVWMNKKISVGSLNVLKDKLMQMTDGNCRFCCKMNSTCWKKSDALEEVSESEENIPTESNVANYVSMKMENFH
ncbi:Eukaryotic translation initiation factor 4E [Trichinella pseudospiralis]|uniref:Eukaryotic translation initiation factor 4E n=1 Tax=Trichinella pseudospiralis TaxID=6337 RepID=A0A0V0XEQ2_TRIPS|nr:Eukaryotic translation initiation factor 4E [Trichinella pseudospiralis]KRX87330.1 Eukaryotic translation initiation factor 4E [Trichinella pseudospiralis]